MSKITFKFLIGKGSHVHVAMDDQPFPEMIFNTLAHIHDGIYPIPNDWKLVGQKGDVVTSGTLKDWDLKCGDIPAHMLVLTVEALVKEDLPDTGLTAVQQLITEVCEDMKQFLLEKTLHMVTLLSNRHVSLAVLMPMNNFVFVLTIS